MNDAQIREWRTTIVDLRTAAETASDPTMLNRARIGMLELLAAAVDLRRQVRDLEELLRREEARA